jgi:ATP-dependent RNA helicase DDX46/PRP5
MEDYVHRVGRTGRGGYRGTAYTFITPEEEQYAENIVRVLELSNQPVPDDLRMMVKNFKEKVHSGAIVAYHPSGFKGHGYQFGKSERERKEKEKKARATSYGMGTYDDEDIDIKGGEENGTDNNSQLALYDPKKKEEEMKKRNMFKDPKAKQIAIDCAMNTIKVK